MSARRIYIDGKPAWDPCDDGATPHRGSRGIRGATFENPVMGSHVVGESTRSRLNRQTREYKEREAAAAKVRRAAR